MEQDKRITSLGVMTDEQWLEFKKRVQKDEGPQSLGKMTDEEWEELRERVSER